MNTQKFITAALLPSFIGRAMSGALPWDPGTGEGDGNGIQRSFVAKAAWLANEPDQKYIYKLAPTITMVVLSLGLSLFCNEYEIILTQERLETNGCFTIGKHSLDPSMRHGLTHWR